MRLRWVGMVMVLAACRPDGAADVRIGEVPDFGDVPLGTRRVVQLALENAGASAASLELSATEPFFIEASTRTLASRTTATLGVGLNATRLGPQTGELRIVENGVETVRSLRAEVIGAAIEVVTEYRFPSAYWVSDGLPEIASGSLIIRNVGTAGSLLTLGMPRVEGSADLCAGVFNAGSCQAWAPEPLLATAGMRVLPLQFRPTRAGPQAWTVVLPSSDALRPEIRIEVSAAPTTLETCDLEAAAPLRVGVQPVVIGLSRRGSKPCLVRSIRFQFGGAFELLEGPALPLEVPPDGTFQLRVAALPATPPEASDQLVIDSAGEAPFKVRLVRSLAECLEFTPPTVDFGTVNVGCAKAVEVSVRNVCSLAVPALTAAIQSPGEQPGRPGCPGPQYCREFTSIGASSSAGLAPDAGTSFRVQYRPINIGTDTADFLLRVGSEEVPAAMTGRGDTNVAQTDSFQVSERFKLDVVAMVDMSPSFAPRRADVRSNFAQVLARAAGECRDLRWGFASADGDPDAGVRLSLNDAGQSWTSSRDADFIGRALSAFDALPEGSEVEACIGPAADLITDAGVRSGANLMGLCVTDAREQTPAPLTALTRFRAQTDAGYPSWNVIASFIAACSTEAIDDGVHEQLVRASLGSREEVCIDWYGGFFPYTGSCDGPRGPYFLNNRPSGSLEVQVDGATIDPANWSFDSANTSFTFSPAFEPQPGQRITARYVSMCTP